MAAATTAAGLWWPFASPSKDDENKRKTRISPITIIVGTLAGLLFLHFVMVWSAQVHLFSGSAPQRPPPDIPKKIHFTWKTHEIPQDLQENVDSWLAFNPGWRVKVYSDEDLWDYVRKYFKQYLPVFEKLTHPIERADFFKYLVLYREGGVFADLDVECLKPVPDYVEKGDGFIVGWEIEWSTDDYCEGNEAARRRQLLSWTLASVPKHAGLLAMMNFIADNANDTFSKNQIRNTAEKTGPVALTDVILRYIRNNYPTEDSKKRITFLPRVVWGSPDGYGPADTLYEMRAVAHKFMGSWKTYNDFPFGNCAPSEIPFAPVTVRWNPSFDIMTHVTGNGDMEADDDVSGALNNFGDWQPGLPAGATPGVTQVLGALMLDAAKHNGRKGVFVDVGAGYGLYSLAMAAIGFDTESFEMSAKSVTAFAASVEINGMYDRITIHEAALGSERQPICILRKFPGAHVDELKGYRRSPEDEVVDPLCLQHVTRELGSVALEGVINIHVVRVNANGHEPAVLDGMMDIIELQQPVAIMWVWQLGWMNKVAKDAAETTMGKLFKLGYTTVVVGKTEEPCEGEAHWSNNIFTMDVEGIVYWCIVDPKILWMHEPDETEYPQHVMLLHEHIKMSHGRFYITQGHMTW